LPLTALIIAGSPMTEPGSPFPFAAPEYHAAVRACLAWGMRVVLILATGWRAHAEVHVRTG
jgi:hypothetical protein